MSWEINLEIVSGTKRGERNCTRVELMAPESIRAPMRCESTFMGKFGATRDGPSHFSLLSLVFFRFRASWVLRPSHPQLLVGPTSPFASLTRPTSAAK